MRTLAIALGPLVAICLSMQPGAIQAATAVVSDDAYTSEASIKQKRGTQPTIWVNPKQTGFVRFDLSALPSNLPREQIAKATLRLWVSKVIHGGNATASPVESDWNELTITRATAPTVGGTPVGSIALPAGRKSLYVALEITDLVRDWATGVRGNYGVAIKSDGSSSAVFDAKENMATSHEPTLEIVLAGPEGKRGLPGIDGMNGTDGKDGKDGMVGPEGIQGPQGPPPPLPSGTTVLVGSDDAIPAGYADSGARVAGWQVKTAPNTGLVVNGQAAISVIGSRVFMAQNGFVQEFDPVANDWIQPQVQPGLNGAVSAVGANGQIYFFGGYQFVGNQPVGMKTVVSYNPVTGISTPLPDMPTTSVPPNAAFLNGHFYFLSSNDCQDYNAALQQWVTFPLPPTQGSIVSEVVANGGVLYAISGVGELLGIVPGQTPWGSVPLPTPGAECHLVPFSNSELLVINADGNSASTVFRYNATDRSFRSEANLPVQLNGTYGSEAARIGNEIVIFGPNSLQRIVRAPISSFRSLYLKTQ